ncbi:PKD_channel domain-containing protein, partial [Haematococcus lacustris]
NCGAAAAALSSLLLSSRSSEGAAPIASAVSTSSMAAMAALEVPDTTPPIITIKGSGALFMVAATGGNATSSVPGMVNNVPLGSLYVDEGATATDVRTGKPGVVRDISSAIQVTYPRPIDT